MVDLKGDHFTFGCEWEFSDWDTKIALPKGFGRSPDYTIVNSNGIAAQPNPKIYRYGGEINTPPTNTPESQADLLYQILDVYPNVCVNYRSNLHIHVRVPGLKDSLRWLKHLQKYIHHELPAVIDLIEPIPKSNTIGEKKREKRRYVSHHTFLIPQRLVKQLAATTIQEFFEKEVPCTKAGKPMWHAQPRIAVGVRQLLQTDTIEFRHFPGTLSRDELLTCIHWCKDFLLSAFTSSSLSCLWSAYKECKFPKFPSYDFGTEVKYQATASHNGLKQEQIKKNIQNILLDKFIGSEAYFIAKAKAKGFL